MLHKDAVQMASADADRGGDRFDVDMSGIVMCDKPDGAFDILQRQSGGRRGRTGLLDEQGQKDV